MVYTRMKELGQQREYWSVLLGRLVFCGVVVALLLWQRLGGCMVYREFERVVGLELENWA